MILSSKKGILNLRHLYDGGEGMAEFARILIQLRERANMNQKTLAATLGITPSVVSQYEKGKAMPGYDVMQKIADHFHVSVDYLLGRDKPAMETEQWLNASFDGKLTNRQFLEQCTPLSQEQRKLLCGILQLLKQEEDA